MFSYPACCVGAQSKLYMAHHSIIDQPASSCISDNDDGGEAWDLSDSPPQQLGTSSSSDLQREWASRHSHFHTLGYRDGIEAGKASSVQEGFEIGFTEAVDAGFRCGLTRGWTSAFTALPESAQKLLLDDTLRLQVHRSHTSLSSISSDNALHLFHREIISKTSTDLIATGEDSIKEGTSSDYDLTNPLPTTNEIEKLHVDLRSMLQSAGVIFELSKELSPLAK